MADRSLQKLIFDLDDTIVYTSVNYETAHLMACVLVLKYARQHAPYKDNLIALQEKIDDFAVEKNGFSDTYHEKALIDFLEKVCADAKLPISNAVRDEMIELSKYPFDPKHYTTKNLIPGAEETLEFLAENNVELALVTRGVPKTQIMKIEQLGLYRFFKPENVHVVEKNDKKEVLKQLSDGYDIQKVGLVDDALSMINIATSLGLKGFFIPLERGCRKRENDVRGVLYPHLTIPLENIRRLKSDYGEYSNFTTRLSAKDLPAYVKNYLLKQGDMK